MRGSTTAKVGLHVRCFDEAHANLLAESDVVDGAVLSCPAHGLLAFSATNTSPSATNVVAVIADVDGKTLATTSIGGDVKAVPAGAVDAPFTSGVAPGDLGRDRFVVRAVVDDARGSRTLTERGLTVEVKR